MEASRFAQENGETYSVPSLCWNPTLHACRQYWCKLLSTEKIQVTNACFWWRQDYDQIMYMYLPELSDGVGGEGGVCGPNENLEDLGRLKCLLVSHALLASTCEYLGPHTTDMCWNDHL